MAHYPVCVSLPAIDVYLVENFFKGLTDRPPRIHTHPAYELVCIEKDLDIEFRIIPPLMEHLAVYAPTGKITSLLFSLTPEVDEDICAVFKSIQHTPVSIPDDFQGHIRIRNAKRLAENMTQPGAKEQLSAEFRLLFICLARKLACAQPDAHPQSQTLYEKRLAILEDYFNIGLKDPDCCKAQLASLLGVTERQLTRILTEAYHSTFSEILLRSRMSIAHAMVMEGRKHPAQIAEAVGYRSTDALKRAYRAFFGFPLKVTAKQDIKTA